MKSIKIFLFLFLLIFSLGIFSEAQAVAIDSATVNLKSALTVTNNRYAFVNVTSSTNGNVSGVISCGATCEKDYTYGSIVTVTAPPQANFSVRISGGCTASGAVGVAASCNVTMNSAKTVDVVYTGVNLPTLTTEPCSAINATGASSGGNITSAGSSSVTSRGVVWSTLTGPTTALITKTNNGSGIGSFTSSMTPLTLGTNYYVRAYATNGSGTSYGNEVLCRTRLLTVNRNDSSNTSTVTSSTNGNISGAISCGAYCNTQSKYYTYNSPVTIQAPAVTGYSVAISGGCTASGAVGVAASCNVTMDAAKTVNVVYTIAPSVPTLTTTACSAINATGASSGGNITSAGSSSVTSRGVVWSTSTIPNTLNIGTVTTKTSNGTGVGVFSSSLTPLNASTSYFVRAYATNTAGTGYGNEISCVTASLLTVNRNDSSNTSTVTSSGNGAISGAISCGAYCNTQSKYYTHNTTPVLVSAPAVTGYSVSISGGCTASGAVGVAASCNVTMNAAKTVNVVYTVATSVPTVINPTSDTPSITKNTATLGATVSSLGIPATLTARGVQYGLGSNYTTKVPANLAQTINTPYTTLVSGLSCGTTYSYRGYATNTTGDGYSGGSTTFTTSACDPSVVNLGIDGNINLKLKEVDYNAVVNLIWTSTNASSCTLSTIQNNITVKSDIVTANSNNYSLGNLKKTTKYTLTCGTGPNNNGTVDVTVRKPNVNWTEN